MWTLAAEAAATTTGIDPTAAFLGLVGAVGVILGSAFGFMLALTRGANERVDGVNRQQVVDLRADLQTANGETLAAEKDRDLWRDRATKLEIENATVKAENRRLKAGK